MAIDGFGFYFEKQGLNGYEGPNIPAAEHFSGTDIEQALARELIQNALDAKAPESTHVEVIFELRTMETASVPDIDGLRSVLPHVVDVVSREKLEGREALVEAFRSASGELIPVLRISDTGTKGLTGSESVHSQFSPLSVLTRSVGASAGDESRGGSFGIGSSVGVLASRMRTVAYVTKPIDGDTTVLAATARLAGFRDSLGEHRQGTGHLTSLNLNHEFEYPRGITHIGPFDPRTVDGTDVYVLDYTSAHVGGGLFNIKRSAAENFWAAIHEGRLVVRGTTDDAGWVLSAETLEQELVNDELLAATTLPFYRAVTAGEQRTATLATVGEVELYVTTEDLEDGFRATQLMRSPLMKVQNITHRVVSLPYAGVFICRNQAGNELLRSIEPPAHDRWNDKGTRSNRQAVSEIRTFIREALRDIVPKNIGDRAEIRGLAKFLPAGLTGPTPPDGARHESNDGTPANREGKVEVGRPDETEHRDWEVNRPAALKEHSLDDESGVPGATGPQGGTAGPPSTGVAGGGQGGAPKPARPGNGRRRIRSTDVTFRAFAPAGSGHTTIVLAAPTEISGDLELRAIGGGREMLDPGITRAEIVMRGGHALEHQQTEHLRWNEATLLDLTLEPNIPVTIEVDFGFADRYRLGIRDA